jgi:site-specific DNA recombinase
VQKLYIIVGYVKNRLYFLHRSPALQKLISDIKEGKINCVLVNRVDRLSRSLIDFSQLLEFFEQHNVAFVSVTQHFNTKTSMGRLTLNILLSFAQFEREIISERTRDKMGAAKKKGKWVGGRPPLGYDLDLSNHKIIVNQREAEVVKLIFDLYIKERSLLSVTKILNERGYRTKLYRASTGKSFGGLKFKSTGVQHILKNPLYIGKVAYHNELYPGNQERIIVDDVFLEAQKILAENKPVRHVKITNRNTALLKGILRCKACNCAMYFSYNIKASKYRYHYYLCMSASKRGYKTCPTRLLSAPRMEKKVLEYLRMLCPDQRLKADHWDTLV